MKFKEGKIIEKFSINGIPFIIRCPRKSDVSQLLKYINSLIDEKVFILSTKRKTRKDEEKWLNDLLNKMKKKEGILLITERGGKIISTCNVSKGGEGANRHVGTIGLCIAKGYRNAGLGTKLMKKLLEVAKKDLRCSVAMLSVFEKNTRAIHVYEKVGFKKTGKIPKGIKFHGKDQDEIIMVRDI